MSLARIRQSLPLLGWLASATMGFVAISQAFGFTWIPALWALQAFTPFVLGWSLPIAVVAAASRRRSMTAVNLGILLGLIWLMAPIVFHGHPGELPADAPRLTVASANLYYRTDRADEAVGSLLALDADVIAMIEYSATVETAFAQLGGRERYPFESSRAPGDRNGVALFSRYPILDATVAPIGRSLAVDAMVDIGDAVVRVVVVHPLPGTDGDSLEAWTLDISEIGRVVDPSDLDAPPTLIVGDFNATRWHPAFRDVLRRGWRSVHEVMGDGWSRSWPTGTPWPALVRIDHALVSRTVAVDDVVDVPIPGSDHTGFVFTIAIPIEEPIEEPPSGQ